MVYAMIPEEYANKPLTAELLQRFLEYSFDTLQKYLKIDRKAFIKDPDNYNKRKDLTYIKQINTAAILLRRQLERYPDLERFRPELDLLIEKTRDVIQIRKE